MPMQIFPLKIQLVPLFILCYEPPSKSKNKRYNVLPQPKTLCVQPFQNESCCLELQNTLTLNQGQFITSTWFSCFVFFYLFNFRRDWSHGTILHSEQGKMGGRMKPRHNVIISCYNIMMLLLYHWLWKKNDTHLCGKTSQRSPGWRWSLKFEIAAVAEYQGEPVVIDR